MDFSETTLEIQSLNAKGSGVGGFQRPHSLIPSRVEVFCALPGDEVVVELGLKRHGIYQGRLKEVLRPSEWRVAPRCQHVGMCGGCSWQQMHYEVQLMRKEEIVKKAFSPLLDDTVEVRPIIPCKYPWYYRNKMEFSFSQNRAGERFLGLMIAGSKGRVVNLEECHLVSEWFIVLLRAIRSWWEKSGLEAYRMNDTGSLRTVTVREGARTKEKMVMLTVSGNPSYPITREQLTAFVQTVCSTLSEEAGEISVFLRVHQMQKGFPTQFYEMHLHGPDHIHEKLVIDTGNKRTELTFKISPTSFFQPNSSQAEVLYSQALQMISFPKRSVLDLYAGTGTLGMAMALEAKKVTAIELNPHAVFDAESNKERNGIQNLEIICGDVGKQLAEILSLNPDLIVVDPPRSGLDPLALARLCASHVPEILYISCNPVTQALNIQELTKAGYVLAALQPVDQFPHTVHIENIALLRKI